MIKAMAVLKSSGPLFSARNCGEAPYIFTDMESSPSNQFKKLAF